VSDRIVRSLPVVVVCAGAWLLLHGEITVANVLWGVVLGAGLAVVFPIDPSARRHRLHPWALIKLIAFVLTALVVSSMEVIKLIVRPTPKALRAGVVRIPLEHNSPLTTTIVANSITMTPGTMTLTAGVEPPELHVHAIGLADVDEFRDSVRALERRVVAALEPAPPAPREGAR
jgi:multicomponent Na+:H+ antiporter subunit E